MIRTITVYVVLSVLGAVAFILLFWTPILAPSAFFYRGIVFLVVVGMGLAAVLHRLKRLVMFSLLWFCCMLVFFTHVPVTAQRSVSVFLLKYMEANPTTLFTEEQLRDELINIYVRKHSAVVKRIDEQRQIGTIVQRNGGYEITPRGRVLVQLYKLIATLFHL